MGMEGPTQILPFEERLAKFKDEAARATDKYDLATAVAGMSDEKRMFRLDSGVLYPIDELCENIRKGLGRNVDNKIIQIATERIEEGKREAPVAR